MKIMSRVKKIPGGLMVVPLLLGAIINTLFPEVLKIGTYTTAVFSEKGAASLVGAQLLFVGTQLKFSSAPQAIRRGGVLLITKFLIGAGIGFGVGKLFGMSGILGLSVLALASSLTSGNGGLYMALMGEYGEPTDVGALSVLNIKDGPFLTMLALGASGMASIPFMSLLAAIGPLLVGIILGNLDEDIRKFFKPGAEMIIPCFAFALGAGINLGNVVNAGFSGMLLGLLDVGLGGLGLIAIDKLVNRRPGYAGAGIASASGNSVATPALVAAVDTTMQPYVASATAQCAAAVIVTALLTPVLTAYVSKKFGCAKDKKVLEENIGAA